MQASRTWLLPVSSANGRGTRNLSALGVFVLCLLLIGLAVALDRPIGSALEVRSIPRLNSVAQIFSRLGEGWVLALAGSAAAGLLVLCRRPRVARAVVVVTLAALLTGLSATALRSLVGRTRPHARVPQGVHGIRHQGKWIVGKHEFGSFPSGHAATVVGLVAALWSLNRRASLAAIPYAVLVCWSRVALGSHHFSDIVAAACLALFLGSFFVWCLEPLLDGLIALLARAFGSDRMGSDWRAVWESRR